MYIFYIPNVAIYQKGPQEGQVLTLLVILANSPVHFHENFLWKTHMHLGGIYSEKHQPCYKFWEKIKWNILTFNADCGWIWFSDSDMQPYSEEKIWTTIWFNSEVLFLYNCSGKKLLGTARKRDNENLRFTPRRAWCYSRSKFKIQIFSLKISSWGCNSGFIFRTVNL